MQLSATTVVTSPPSTGQVLRLMHEATKSFEQASSRMGRPGAADAVAAGVARLEAGTEALGAWGADRQFVRECEHAVSGARLLLTEITARPGGDVTPRIAQVEDILGTILDVTDRIEGPDYVIE